MMVIIIWRFQQFLYFPYNSLGWHSSSIIFALHMDMGCVFGISAIWPWMQEMGLWLIMGKKSRKKIHTNLWLKSQRRGKVWKSTFWILQESFQPQCNLNIQCLFLTPSPYQPNPKGQGSFIVMAGHLLCVFFFLYQIILFFDYFKYWKVYSCKQLSCLNASVGRPFIYYLNSDDHFKKY